MHVFAERECAPVREAPDPVGVWRYCSCHWWGIQEVPGHCAGHSTAGVAGTGGQGE